MKRFVFIFAITLLFSFNVCADVCVEVNEKSAAKAVSILEQQKEIYDYCSICNDAKPQIISIKNVTKDKKVYVNDKPIDLAHTYFKQDNKYINLGIASGCIEDGQYGISAKLDKLTEFHHAKAPNKEQAKQDAQAIFDVCVTKFKNDKSQTMQDMIERNIKINNCLAEAIKQEIKKGFNEKQQAQMLTYFEQTRKGIWNFTNSNKSQNF